jgi:hypothetical protein
MAGRPRIIRSIQSYVNKIDNTTFSGSMKMGTGPSIGVTRNFWHNYKTECNQKSNAVKKSYSNMVFLNVNSVQTPLSFSFNRGHSNIKNYNNNSHLQVNTLTPNSNINKNTLSINSEDVSIILDQQIIYEDIYPTANDEYYSSANL